MSPRRADPPALEYILLGLIHLQPVHGYELFHSFRRDQGIGMIWQVKPARLYAILEKLEGMGWLKSELQSGEGFVQRKQYHTTAQGENAYHEWLSNPVTAPHRMRQEFLARLYFARLEGSFPIRLMITRQMETCQTWLIALRYELENLPAGSFEQEVVQFRIGQIQAMAEWLETLDGALQEKPKAIKERKSQDVE